MLFESVYRELLLAVFGDHGMGRDVVSRVMEESGLFNDYYGNFDEILMRSKSSWFGGVPRDDIFQKAIAYGLAVTAKPYGTTRKVVMTHLLLGGKFPRFLGFDRGPLQLPGNRATVPQGQIFRSAGRVTTFSPSFRMITDMAKSEIHTNIAGGVSDRRFSKWYMSDLKNWLRGVYKVLK
jgi:penicillin amidase